MATWWAVAGRLTAGAFAVIVLAGATACGGVTRFGAAPAGGMAQAPPVTGPNAADVAFVREMIVHHQQSVDMAAMVDIRGSRYEVKTLAAELQRTQRDQLAAMRQWVRDWETADATLSAGPAVDSWQRSPTGPPSTSSAAATPTASEPAPTPGVATSAQLAALARAGGAELDRLFLELLVLHHQRSVELSTRHRVAGADSEVARLTGEILDTHRTRLDAARSLLGTV